MVKKIIKKGVKKGIKKIKEQSGAPEPGTVGARKTTKAKAKTETAKAKEKKAFEKKLKDTFRSPKTLAAEARLNKVASKLSKAKPTGVTKVKPKPKAKVATSPVATKGKKSGLNKREKAGLAVAGATAAGFIGTGLAKRKKPASKAAKVTFGEAFKAARKKGEGTKFTWNGKSYTAVTKDDLKKKGYDANELRQYANRKGKARGPLRRAGQGIKKVLLGKDKKFGGDKGAIDFIRRPKKKAGGGMANSSEPKKYQSGGMATKKYKAGGLATKGLGKAYMNSKR